MDYLIGALFTVMTLFSVLMSCLLGMHLGKQLAVDHTKKDGFFEAYGKKWRAVMVEQK